MRKPTPAQIKHIVENKPEPSPFFSRDTLKFFGQYMRDFKTAKSPGGRIFLYAPARDPYENIILSYTFQEWNQESESLTTVRDDNGRLFTSPRTLQDVLNFIENH